ncbi:hypothetical protein DFH09DRAFT_1145636 [Mycena vulgaris]|nr:hypothetical protein DFH09DRAFT_1145636 [Mycena vulgaris]
MTVRIWDVETGEMEQALLHSSSVEAVTFSPDGAQLTSTGWDSERKTWNLGDTGWLEFKDIVSGSDITFPPRDYPQETMCQFDQEHGYLSMDDKSSGMGNRLYMWTDYAHVICPSAFQGTKACLGYRSGRVVVVDLAEW